MSDIDRITARGLIYKDGKVFAVRQKDYATGQPKDFWCLPGGKLDDGESISDCMSREIQEELGVKPEIGNLLYVQQFKDDDKQAIDFIFHITNADAFQHIDLSSTSHGEAELEEHGFVVPAAVNMRPDFLRRDNLQEIIRIGSTRLYSYL